MPIETRRQDFKPRQDAIAGNIYNAFDFDVPELMAGSARYSSTLSPVQVLSRISDTSEQKSKDDFDKFVERIHKARLYSSDSVVTAASSQATDEKEDKRFLSDQNLLKQERQRELDEERETQKIEQAHLAKLDKASWLPHTTEVFMPADEVLDTTDAKVTAFEKNLCQKYFSHSSLLNYYDLPRSNDQEKRLAAFMEANGSLLNNLYASPSDSLYDSSAKSETIRDVDIKTFAVLANPSARESFRQNEIFDTEMRYGARGLIDVGLLGGGWATFEMLRAGVNPYVAIGTGLGVAALSTGVGVLWGRMDAQTDFTQKVRKVDKLIDQIGKTW